MIFIELFCQLVECCIGLIWVVVKWIEWNLMRLLIRGLKGTKIDDLMDQICYLAIKLA